MTETLGQRLKRLIDNARKAGMTISAESLSYAGDIIHGRVRDPSMTRLIEIARQLDVPVEQLVFEQTPLSQSPDYASLRETAEEFGQAEPEKAPLRPPLDPDVLAVILAALPYALKRIGIQPSHDRIAEAIRRTHDWMQEEAAGRRYPSPELTINYLSEAL